MERHSKLFFRVASVFVLTLAGTHYGRPQDAAMRMPASGVIGVSDRMLSASYWIARTPDADRVLMDADQVREANKRLFQNDKAMVDLRKLGPTLVRAQVLNWAKQTGPVPELPQLDAEGHPIAQEALRLAIDNVGEASVPDTSPIRYGMAVRRSILRSFPTRMQAFPSRGLMDFDSFAGGVLFPGDPVVIAHVSADKQWFLVVTEQGPEWAATRDIAQGTAEQIFRYTAQKQFRVATGDEVRTVFTPEEPRVSEVQLDMGTRVPLAALPEGQPVNGQGPYAAWTVLLPVRNNDGSLAFKPALLRRTADSTRGYLPLTRANIIGQAFKLLGERYGWGHAYNGRDCSGFTADTYRSMGLLLPGNSAEQGQSPAFRHEAFGASDSHEKRLNALMHAHAGDLVVVPGHVMMIVGKVAGEPYVIQDVPFAVFHRGNKIQWTKLNEVSVTPLLPLLADEKHTYVDVMTSLVYVTSPQEQ